MQYIVFLVRQTNQTRDEANPHEFEYSVYVNEFFIYWHHEKPRAESIAKNLCAIWQIEPYYFKPAPGESLEGALELRVNALSNDEFEMRCEDCAKKFRVRYTRNGDYIYLKQPGADVCNCTDSSFYPAEPSIPSLTQWLEIRGLLKEDAHA